MCRSVPQMDATLTLTSTSVRPKAGILTSRISAPGLGSGFTTASMELGIRSDLMISQWRSKLLILAPAWGVQIPLLPCAWARWSWLSLGHGLAVEILGLAARNTERLPFARTDVLGQENDLPGMLSVVCDAAIESL